MSGCYEVSTPPTVITPINNFRYVAPNGSDVAGDGSIAKPFATVTAAMASITTNAPTVRWSIFVTGRITEAVAITLKPNVFIVGVDPQNTRIQAASWEIGADWTPAGDHRSGFLNITVSGAITIDWNAQSSNEGKFFFNNAWINSAVTFTRFSDINQIFVTQCLTFATWTFNGCAVTSQTTYYQANVVLTEGPAAGRFALTSGNDLFLATLQLTRTAAADTAELNNSYCAGLTVAGALAVSITPDGVPAQPALSGGASLVIRNSSVRQTFEVAAVGANTIASAVYATLLSQAITMGNSGLLHLDATASFTNDSVLTTNVFFQVQINGTTLRSASAACILNSNGSAAITARVAIGASGLVAGANTVTLRWRCAAGTTTINPATDGQHAALRLQELTA